MMLNTENATGEVSPQPPRKRKRGTRHKDTEDCKAAIRRSSLCIWPGCNNQRAPYAYGKDMPLCIGHVYETWRRARDLADVTINREKTAKVPLDGTLKVVERPVAKRGWIYYLRIDGHIKVGYASDLLRRLRQYPPTSEFIYAHRGTKTDEKVIHSLLYLHRAAGREWYRPHAEIDRHIEQMKARYGPARDPRPDPKPESTGHTIQLRRRSGGSYSRKAG